MTRTWELGRGPHRALPLVHPSCPPRSHTASCHDAVCGEPWAKPRSGTQGGPGRMQRPQQGSGPADSQTTDAASRGSHPWASLEPQNRSWLSLV